MKTPIALAGASALVLSLAIAPADMARAQEAEDMEEDQFEYLPCMENSLPGAIRIFSPRAFL